jgi:hypothetical protein
MPLDVLGLEALVARDDVKGDFLALHQRFEPAPHDGCMMHENILPRILGDEAESFFVVEPLNFATSHSFSPELMDAPPKKIADMHYRVSA